MSGLKMQKTPGKNLGSQGGMSHELGEKVAGTKRANGRAGGESPWPHSGPHGSHEAGVLPSSFEGRATRLRLPAAHLWSIRLGCSGRSCLCRGFWRREGESHYSVSGLSIRDQTWKTLCPGSARERKLACTASASN